MSVKSIVITLITIISIIFFSKDVSAEAIKVSSYNDFRDKLCMQIRNHTEQQFYEFPSSGLAREVQTSDFGIDLSYHYNPKDPLNSGCYLQSFVESYLTTTYSNKMFLMRIMFRYSKEDIDAHLENIEKISKSLKKATDFETILAVHDYLVDNFVYDDFSEKTAFRNHTDLEGFRDGRMVCSGYAWATYYMLNCLGIKTRLIYGYGGEGTGSENHAWNIVNLDNTWYNVDVTWDDFSPGKKDYTYFLKSDKDFKLHQRTDNDYQSKVSGLLSPTSYKLPKELIPMNTKPIAVGILLTLSLAVAALIAKEKSQE